MDNRFDNDNSVAAGFGERHHDGFAYSHPAGRCHYPSAGKDLPGAENLACRR